MSSDIRYNMTDIVRQEIENVLMNLYTSIPAIVQSYNSVKQTVNVQVAVETPTHFGDNIPPSYYYDIPVVFPSAADWVIAGPISQGDSIILLVPHYGTEEYFSGNKNKVGKPTYVTRHDLNHAVAITGMFTSNSVTRKEGYKNTFHVAKGDNVVFFDDTTITIKTPANEVQVTDSGDINITGNVTITGNLDVTGSISTDTNLDVTGTTTTTGLVANSIDMVTHTHGYTDDGSPLVTGVPNP